MAIHNADKVLRVKMGVDYLFLPFIRSSVLRMNVLTQLIEGPKRNTLRARPILAQTVSAFLMLITS